MPRSRYAADLEQGIIREDAAQEIVIDKLHVLAGQLCSQPEPKPDWKAKILCAVKKQPLKASPLPGLYIWGTVGRGKTYLMDVFYEHLPIQEKLRLHFHRFMREVHDVLKQVKDAQEPLNMVADHFRRKTKVLCLDELFVSDIGDAMILAGLFEGLFDRGITLVTTSNVPPDHLYKDGLQRQRFIPAIELLKQHTETVELGGNTDHRLEYLESADIYHTPLDADSNNILLNNFTNISPDPGIENDVLSIENRTIQSVRCADGVVWFEFAEICDGPRSANDYIEIARCFNSVLISDIPVFENQDDLARRFITLVDEFYDRNVKLIVSAQAAPDQLYRGKRLEFEFQRTVSRLIEMQSHDYLSRPHKSL